MTIGEGCKSKPLLHKGTSERESLPRDTQQSPSFNTCYHIQENLHSFRRTRAKVRSRVTKHVAARRWHRIMDEGSIKVRRGRAINQGPDDLNACRDQDDEKIRESPRSRGRGYGET